jgi:hypothetical protein
MEHEQALMIVNSMQRHMSQLAGSIVTMLADKKVSPWEGMQVSMQAMQLGSYVMMTCQSLDDETKKDLLYVLEHGEWSLPAVETMMPHN